MKPYFAEHGSTIIHGDCRCILPALKADRFDTVITDPPYELGFMGKSWDRTGVAFQPNTWAEVLRVCKPGAILLAFGGTRTWHRLACAIEDAGWEIRDSVLWLYGQGFPKSLDISKAIDKAAGADRKVVSQGKPLKRMIPGADQNATGSWIKDNGREYVPTETIAATAHAKLWQGWGTALKPAWEPCVLAMKPLDGTFAENAIEHGVAGLNIDGGRIGSESTIRMSNAGTNGEGWGMGKSRHVNGSSTGRWPANVMLDEIAARMLDEQSGDRIHGAGHMRTAAEGTHSGGQGVVGFTYGAPAMRYGDDGGASRFFYTAKASRSDRGAGNDHPTVKPTDLIKYLCQLTATPTGGEILDPFGGSMTTLVAARECGRPAVAIELEERHCRIGAKRLNQGILFGAA